MTNNETLRKFEIIIKLRGDNVYDLYVDGGWISSHGNSDKVLEDVESIVKTALSQTIKLLFYWQNRV